MRQGFALQIRMSKSEIRNKSKARIAETYWKAES